MICCALQADTAPKLPPTGWVTQSVEFFQAVLQSQLLALAAAAQTLSTQHKLWSCLLSTMQINSYLTLLFCRFSQEMLTSQPLDTGARRQQQHLCWAHKKTISWVLYWDCTAPITTTTTTGTFTALLPFGPGIAVYISTQTIKWVYKKLGFLGVGFSSIQIWGLEISHHKMHLVPLT